jgi:hypothetical protein
LGAKNAVRNIGILRWWGSAVNLSFLLCLAALSYAFQRSVTDMDETRWGMAEVRELAGRGRYAELGDSLGPAG